LPANNSHINISGQMDFTRAHGELVHYFVGMKCTCVLQQTGSNYPDANRASPTCMACHGLGWVYQDGGQILGIVSNIQQEKELLMAGIAAPGDLVFSPDLRYVLSDYDKIQLTWPEGIPFEGELITRGTSAADTTMYDVLSVLANGCIAVNPTTGVITQYVPGVDFAYSGNVITWQGSHVPAAGTIYSLKYSALIDWIVFVPPQPRRERGTNLGQRVILKKKHIVFNGV
jgi:hypothetical protein